ncbi:bacteriocin biosynthesis cyclodehydratase domain-containing protein [Actinoalloteichus hoggarensis]|uniref:Uncharacterized protein n=1 Tax=Actinoalloteichus hoggarensis TaxID=1470176 RepID=A0A221VYJ0_9PSEU|nr:hypothetical protein [Actinoalloteichus hoggarensis]ASO18600.1 hypothetical protein AHOG_04720 [Actinoalloteichus hoggarensis]MBB5921968.1 bacteriocin biosynthesis cyclodehydratase domain-containing protein [Actinoalloteichus hoggarensis]
MSTLRVDPRLPERPRLAPGFDPLRRDGRCLQFGTDPRHAVLVEEVPPELAARTTQLTGEFTTAQLLRQCAEGGGPPAALLALLGQLAAEGVLDDAAHPRAAASRRHADEDAAWRRRGGVGLTNGGLSRQDSSVVVIGDGRLAAAVIALLAVSGVGWVRPRTNGRVIREDVGRDLTEDSVGRDRAEATRAMVERLGTGTRTTARGGRRRPDLVLLADSLVPDPAVVAELVADGVPHLLVTSAEGGMVGPLVVPGRSSCLECADRHRCLVDPQWPMLAAQLAGRTQRTDAAGTSAVAALAAAQSLTFLHGRAAAAPAVWNAAVEIDPFSARLRRHPRPPHPDCPCGARARTDRCGGVRIDRFPNQPPRRAAFPPAIARE